MGKQLYPIAMLHLILLTAGKQEKRQVLKQERVNSPRKLCLLYPQIPNHKKEQSAHLTTGGEEKNLGFDGKALNEEE